MNQRNFVPLIGLERDPTFEANKYFIKDEEPLATALGLFRHEDADYRFSLTAIAPMLAGWHKLRVSAYSFWWDGVRAVPTDCTGVIGFGIHGTGEQFGMAGAPANRGGVAEIGAWLQRSGGSIHGTDNHLRLILASCERVRDFRRDANTPGPPRRARGSPSNGSRSRVLFTSSGRQPASARFSAICR